MARPLGRPKLARGFGLDLADVLPRYVKLLTDLFQRVLALAADPEAQPDGFAIFNQIAQRGLAVAAHRSITSRRSKNSQAIAIRKECAKMDVEYKMKAVEFKSTITQEGQIPLPPDVAAEIPVGEQLRVVLMWEPSDLAWRSAGRQRFEAAYSPEDAVYEQLIDDAAAR